MAFNWYDGRGRTSTASRPRDVDRQSRPAAIDKLDDATHENGAALIAEANKVVQEQVVAISGTTKGMSIHGSPES
jgi:hypothetical protein